MERPLAFLGALLLLALPAFGQTPEEPAFNLSRGDVGKVAILTWDTGRTILEVTYNKEKQAEFSKIASGNLGKKVKIVLNGKTVSEVTITQDAVGHSLKIDQPSPEAALEVAKALFKPKS